MAFGLGKSEKRPEDEGDLGHEDPREGSEDMSPPNSHRESENGDSPAAASPAADAQAQESAEYRPEAFRPTFLDESKPGDSAATSASPTRQPQGDAFFVSVTRQDTTDIHRFDSPTEAQTCLEQLLEEGIPEEEVAAFSGQRLSFKVSHRPIVKLSTTEAD
jgi:hypothetical protein